jgi:vacuolar-type H+-ATPase subunit E/Vma4
METYQDSSEKLRTEILAEARRRGEEMIIRAKQEAEALLARAAAEGDRVGQELLDQAYAEAERRSELILATVPVEAGKLLAARVEELLENVHEAATRQLLAREGFDYTRAIVALASHAIHQMTGDAFVVKISGTDRTLSGEELAKDIAQDVGRPVKINVSFEENVFGGGVVVEDEEARQVWDNRFLRRMERMWPEMRRHIARQVTPVLEKRATGDEP